MTRTQALEQARALCLQRAGLLATAVHGESCLSCRKIAAALMRAFANDIIVGNAILDALAKRRES